MSSLKVQSTSYHHKLITAGQYCGRDEMARETGVDRFQGRRVDTTRKRRQCRRLLQRQERDVLELHEGGERDANDWIQGLGSRQSRHAAIIST